MILLESDFFVYAKFCFVLNIYNYQAGECFFQKKEKTLFSSKIICYRHNFHPICSKIDMDHGHDVAYGDGEQEVCQMKYRNSKLNKILTSQNQLISFVILFFSNSVALLPNHGQKSMEKNTYKYPRMYWLTVATIEPIANHFEYAPIAKKCLLKKIVHFISHFRQISGVYIPLQRPLVGTCTSYNHTISLWLSNCQSASVGAHILYVWGWENRSKHGWVGNLIFSFSMT